MVSGAALNVTIRLSSRRLQIQAPALTAVEMARGMLHPARRCGCLSIQTVAQHCRVIHYKTVRQEGSGSQVTDRAWRTCGNGWRGNEVYHR
jgi:hypothetical protein